MATITRNFGISAIIISGLALTVMSAVLPSHSQVQTLRVPQEFDPFETYPLRCPSFAVNGCTFTATTLQGSYAWQGVAPGQRLNVVLANVIPGQTSLGPNP